MDRYIRITALFVFFAFISFSLKAQLLVEGRLLLKNEQNSEGAILKIEKNSNIIDRINLDKRGDFNYDLELNNEYKLHFVKDGYVTKQIEVNTNVPSGKESNSFQPLYFEVEIFKSVPNSELGPFKYPVGKIVYNSSIDEFDYDVDYSRKIQNQIRKKEKAYNKARDEYEEQQREKRIAQKKEELKKEKEKERKKKQEFIQQQKEKAKKRKEKLEKQKEEERKRKEKLKQQMEERAKERADSVAKAQAEKQKERQERLKQQQEKIQEELAQKEEEENQKKQEKLNNIEKSVEKEKQELEQKRQQETNKKQELKKEVKKEAEERKEQKQKRRELNEKEKKELIDNQINKTKKNYLREIFENTDKLLEDGFNSENTDKKEVDTNFYRKVDEYEGRGMHIKRIIIQQDDKINVYHKVKHNWGGVFYFKDYRSIGKYQYEIESSGD